MVAVVAVVAVVLVVAVVAVVTVVAVWTVVALSFIYGKQECQNGVCCGDAVDKRFGDGGESSALLVVHGGCGGVKLLITVSKNVNVILTWQQTSCDMKTQLYVQVRMRGVKLWFPINFYWVTEYRGETSQTFI